jgi:hypothetical protein
MKIHFNPPTPEAKDPFVRALMIGVKQESAFLYLARLRLGQHFDTRPVIAICTSAELPKTDAWALLGVIPQQFSEEES